MTLAEARRANVLRLRMRSALHSADRLVIFREKMIDLLCDLEEGRLDPQPAEFTADTVRAPAIDDIPVDVEEDVAPSVPADSVVALEYAP